MLIPHPRRHYELPHNQGGKSQAREFAMSAVEAPSDRSKATILYELTPSKQRRSRLAGLDDHL
ncbi:hypothetical protein ABTK37_19620, partial [Acinetobacter baumannii]